MGTSLVSQNETAVVFVGDAGATFVLHFEIRVVSTKVISPVADKYIDTLGLMLVEMSASVFEFFPREGS